MSTRALPTIVAKAEEPFLNDFVGSLELVEGFD